MTVGFGGFLVGVIIGFLASLLCSQTGHDKISQFIDVAIIATFGFFAYSLATFFGWSGIISIIGCGMTERRYGFKCLHSSTKSTVISAFSSLAIVTETLIFLLFGMEIFEVDSWNFEFIAWTILFITLLRFVSVFACGYLLNQLRIWHKLTVKQMIIIR